MNFGEIGANIKDLMEEFQRKTKSQGKIESISDMKVRLFVNPHNGRHLLSERIEATIAGLNC